MNSKSGYEMVALLDMVPKGGALSGCLDSIVSNFEQEFNKVHIPSVYNVQTSDQIDDVASFIENARVIVLAVDEIVTTNGIKQLRLSDKPTPWHDLIGTRLPIKDSFVIVCASKEVGQEAVNVLIYDMLALGVVPVGGVRCEELSQLLRNFLVSCVPFVQGFDKELVGDGIYMKLKSWIDDWNLDRQGMELRLVEWEKAPTDGIERHKVSGRTVVLVGVFSVTDNGSPIHMTQLRIAIEACGAKVAAEFPLRHGYSAPSPRGARRLNFLDKHSYLNPKTAAEVAQLCRNSGADAIVINARLTPAQITALAKLINCDVIDLGALK